MRNPGAFGINHAFVKLYQADVLNQEQVEAALEGSFAAVISVARDIKSDQNLLTEYAGVITKALKAKGVQRVIVIAGAGAIPSGEGKYHVESPHFPPQYVNICHDHLSALKIYEVKTKC
jgi:putative NADH-flavin reductase